MSASKSWSPRARYSLGCSLWLGWNPVIVCNLCGVDLVMRVVCLCLRRSIAQPGCEGGDRVVSGYPCHRMRGDKNVLQLRDACLAEDPNHRAMCGAGSGAPARRMEAKVQQIEKYSMSRGCVEILVEDLKWSMIGTLLLPSGTQAVSKVLAQSLPRMTNPPSATRREMVSNKWRWSQPSPTTWGVWLSNALEGETFACRPGKSLSHVFLQIHLLCSSCGHPPLERHIIFEGREKKRRQAKNVSTTQICQREEETVLSNRWGRDDWEPVSHFPGLGYS